MLIQVIMINLTNTNFTSKLDFYVLTYLFLIIEISKVCGKGGVTAIVKEKEMEKLVMMNRDGPKYQEAIKL